MSDGLRGYCRLPGPVRCRGCAAHRGCVRLAKREGQEAVHQRACAGKTWTLLARRSGYAFAAERAKNVYASPDFEILYRTREDEIEAVEWFLKYGDHRVSFTDCVSFVLMKRRRIRTAFTFDRHFRDAGFEVIGL